jgi:predicted metal-binding membrane protein
LTATSFAAPVRPSPLQALVWRHPEWWILGLSLAAWLGWLATPGPNAHLCLTVGRLLLSPSAAARLASSGAAATLSREWALMAAAMMLPLVAAPARSAAFRSLWSRRQTAAFEVVVGFAGVWMAAGLLLLPLVVMAAPVLDRHSVWAGPAAPAAAAAWRWTPLRAAATRSCHRRPPLAPRGWRAHGDCLRFGVAQGGACVASCWILMLAPMVAPGGARLAPWLMPALLVERLLVRPPRIWVFASWGCASFGVALCAALGLHA